MPTRSRRPGKRTARGRVPGQYRHCTNLLLTTGEPVAHYPFILVGRPGHFGTVTDAVAWVTV
jgi:hypothetical protein